MRLFGLIGFPLSHSFSPGYFREKFTRLGIRDVEYRLFPLEDIAQLHVLLTREPELEGFNVTIPHKQNILPLLDEHDPEAAAVQAVNTVKVLRSGNRIRLIGFNTDVFGFRSSISPFLTAHHERALVLGSGGASRAVMHVLKGLGINARIVSRGRESGLTYAGLTPEIIRSHPLIINTTPAGMYPAVDTMPPLPEYFFEHTGPHHFLYDLIYNPVETLFLKKGKERGAFTMNGLNMLHLQADEAWNIWNS